MGETGRLGRRFSLASLVAVALITAIPSGASAATTIGQLGPTGTFGGACSDTLDLLQPSVTSGNTYVVPADGAVTSWSHAAGTALGQMLTMKVFRHVAGPTYMAVGHDGPRALTPSSVNTFSGISIPVMAGDVLGLHTDTDNVRCAFDAPGESWLLRVGDLGDGESGDFGVILSDTRLNISAVVEPPTGPSAPPSTLPSTCKGKPATHVGTPGDDLIKGTNGPDVIAGLGGDDKIKGFGGKDLICGGDGADIIKGANRADRLFGENGHDRIFGGAGKDSLRGGSGKDKLFGRGNRDDLKGNRGDDKLVGGGGNDILRGNKGNDKLFGQGGKDICKGGAKADKAKTCEVEKAI